MKKIKHFQTKIWMFLIMVALVLPFAIPEKVSAEEKGSITIRLSDLKTPKSNVGFTAYRVGDWSDEGKWVLDESLSDTGVVLEKLTYADEWDAAAAKLVQAKGFQNLSKASGKTDASGTLQLADLDWGMYLILQNSGTEEYGTVSPFLAAIPFVEKGVRSGDLTVEPKAKAPVKEEDGKITVTKRTGYMDPKLLEVVDMIPSDATYYVGIFQDQSGQVPFGTDFVKKIRMKGIRTGTVTFENLPEGTYYIFETDSEGNAYQMNDLQSDNGSSFACQVEDGSTQEITLDGKAESPAGTVALLNLYYDLPDEFSHEDNTNSAKKNTSGVKTGDQTQILFYIGILAAALTVILALVGNRYLKGRRKHD